MKPKVLISAPSQGENNYTEAFSNFGFSVTSQYLPKYDSGYDALVLSGGGDRQIIITSCESEEYSKYADREIDVSDGKYEIIY